jgi:hypothetical protein
MIKVNVKQTSNGQVGSAQQKVGSIPSLRSLLFVLFRILYFDFDCGTLQFKTADFAQSGPSAAGSCGESGHRRNAGWSLTGIESIDSSKVPVKSSQVSSGGWPLIDLIFFFF